ncbi:tumor necrosis factor receptor superfamily member 21 isoform X1 [Hemiscyllium ocellatum]|uniref:tumor necrosis factor receptor superfamily member 21 isoform X1 n=1 Tax=Hemiscyllium ocellatum TaxID=170820 RepID=UPI0029662985|nr:tumor necrosis factor receptor superfamily member 21 isoform X1 [Hemiscyllium ocellatum]
MGAFSLLWCFLPSFAAWTAATMHWSILTLLFVLLGDITAQVEPAPKAAVSLSGKYHHYDRATGKEIYCNKCPAGTHVAQHCTSTSLRVCRSCKNGTFTKHENGIDQCHTCRPCTAPMIEKFPCTAFSDRECTCPPGTFLSNKICVAYTVCAMGWRVKKKGSETEDVKCKPCPRGTFSNVPSSPRCKPLTNCSEHDLVILKLGNQQRDNICGLPSTIRSTTINSSSTESTRHNSGVLPDASTPSGIPNQLSTTTTKSISGVTKEAQLWHSSHSGPNSPLSAAMNFQPIMESSRAGADFRPPRKGPPRPSAHKHFDINEHLPWMIVLFLLLVLVVTVVCSIKKSSHVLKKGPKQDPSSIVEKAGLKKPISPSPNKEKWIYYYNGQGVDILKLVAAQIGSQWKDIYQFLANAAEREVTAFSNGYSGDHERAYAALQHWTIRDPEANLAKLISALRRYKRNDVVENIRGLMEDTSQLDLEKLVPVVNNKNGVASNSAVPNSAVPNSAVPNSAVPNSAVETSSADKTKVFFVDESEPLLRCDSTSSTSSSVLSRTGSFISKEKKDTILRQVRLDPCDLQPIFDDTLHILNQEELGVIEEIPHAEDKLDKLFEIAGGKSQGASQKLLDSVYSHLPDLL